jgi:hypothetical protein
MRCASSLAADPCAPAPVLPQRYRVCEKDALAPSLMLDGQLQRFCQQVRSGRPCNAASGRPCDAASGRPAPLPLIPFR